MNELINEGNEKYFKIGCWTIWVIVMIFGSFSLFKECKSQKSQRPIYFRTGCFVADVNYSKESTESYAHYTAIIYIDKNNKLKKMELLNGSDIEKVVESSIMQVVEYEEYGFTLYLGNHNKGSIEDPAGEKRSAFTYDERYSIVVVGRPNEPCEYDFDDSGNDLR